VVVSFAEGDYVFFFSSGEKRITKDPMDPVNPV
jgi:hypothetical protein